MNIAIERRHAFYLDADDQPHALPTHRFDRLWRGKPDAAMPELAGQRIRFAILHTERFDPLPRVIVEHYPVVTFDADGSLDLDLQQAQLHAEVDHLEANGYAPALATTEPHEPATTWRPDHALRRRLLASLAPSTNYRSRATPAAPCSRAEEPRATYGRPRHRDDRLLRPRLPSSVARASYPTG